MPLQILSIEQHAGAMPEDQLADTDDSIADRILLVRGQRVLLDADLAAMYGVTTKRLNEQVRRNLDRFPPDFSFVLEDQDFAILRSQIATSSFMTRSHGGRRTHPRAFTEHGVIMAATLLNSPRAIQMSVYVVRAFVKLRKLLASNTSMVRRLEALERSVSNSRSLVRLLSEHAHSGATP